MAKRGRILGNTKAAATTSPAGVSADDDGLPLGYYRPAATRKNNPPAKIAAEGEVLAISKAKYVYTPHLPPVLWFGPISKHEVLHEMLAKSRCDPVRKEGARTQVPRDESEYHRPNVADGMRHLELWIHSIYFKLPKRIPA